jgi:hypothetical protein
MNKPAADFPTIAEAKLPATYEAALTAIAECERVDECKNWADQAAAMRAYAAMRDDRRLHLLALRIQLRAERRCGELLKQVEVQPGKRTDLEPGGGAPTRLQAATEAGMSKAQMLQSVRIATVPGDDFEAQVESAHPPTVTQLARQGVAHRATEQAASHPPVQQDESESSPANEALEAFVRFCVENDPGRLARTASGHDGVALRRAIGTVERWLRQFAEHLP